MTLSVRRANLKDAAAFARIMGDPAVFPGLLQLPYCDEETWRVRLADGAAPGKIDLPLVAELNGEVVGNAGLHPVGPGARRRHAMTIGMAVLPQAQGQGVGSALMAALCEHADRWLGVLRIELTVYTDNPAAIRLYRKFGFEIEGTFKGYALRDGVYVDAHSMARLHPSPPSIHGG